MNQEKTQTIRIDSKKHNILGFYCKFKGITIKDYIHKKLDQDLDFIQFKKRIEEIMFK